MKSYRHATFPLRFDEAQLETVSSELLKPISRRWGGKGNETKAVCIRRILDGLADANAVQAALRELTPDDRAALAILKEQGGVIQVGLLEDMLQAYGYPVARQYGMSHEYGYSVYGRESSYYVAELIRRGYLMLAPRYAAYSPYGDIRYGGVSKGEFVYSDERLLQQIDWPVAVRLLPVVPILPPPQATTVRRPQHVMLDLITVTRTLAEIKQLSLTKTGTIRVADLRNFQKRMSWEDTPAFDGYPFPSMAQAVIAAWHHSGWLQTAENALIASITPEFFAQQSLRKQVQYLINGIISDPNWSEISNIPSYHLEKIRPARFLLFHSLRAFPDTGQFYSVRDFMAALYVHVGESLATQPDYQHPRPVKYNMTDEQYQAALSAWRPQHRATWIERESVFVKAALTSWLYWLGLVELGLLTDNTLAFRLTELAHDLFADTDEECPQAASLQATTVNDSPAWVVQPNYDIVVYLDVVSPAQLAFLEQHAERRQAEAHTAHYQLTRDSVYHGLEGGTHVSDLLATLRTGTKTDLPQNVEREIREWAEQREQLTLTIKARLIAFPSTETRDLALEAGLHGTLIGETYVLVKADAQIKAALKAVFGLQQIPTIDYTQAPVKCLNAEENGRLTLVNDPGDLLLRGQLARCAEAVDATHWRLTPASLAAVRQAGVSAGSLLSFLQSRVQGTLPVVMEVFIGNLLGTRDAVEADTAFVLRVTNKKLYTAITTSTLLKPFLLDVPGPDTIIVSQALLEEFKAKLEWLGVKLTSYSAVNKRPDWQKTVRDAKTQERRRSRY